MYPKLTVLQRLKAPTSKFFRPILRVSATVVALVIWLLWGQALLATDGIPFPDHLRSAIELSGAIALTAAVLSMLTVDYEQLRKDSVLDGIKTARPYKAVLKLDDPKPRKALPPIK
ncbi:hypothetical protein LX87_04090 [Larkinella arboricola]|uniref:Uncharacterized protein n=1 Tax=Larkinella arboricola TaxID=643671 RepID=A0A327WXG3_LARAB|nr:hypothetical protein [Larkinella arboricola]RAJ94205.1 hypothetical protein LX87_04090 [Larkinella arboricola]